MDASRILSAGEWYTGNGLSFGWSVFSALWPFLVVLPFATSFIGEKKDQIVVPAVSRNVNISLRLGSLPLPAIRFMV